MDFYAISKSEPVVSIFIGEMMYEYTISGIGVKLEIPFNELDFSKITFVTNYDDWEAIYYDGKEIWSNHRLDGGDVMKALGVEFLVCDDHKFMERYGNFPPLDELRKSNANN